MSRQWGPPGGGGRMLVVKSAATSSADKAIADWYGEVIANGYNAQCKAKADHCISVYEGIGHESRLGVRYARRPFEPRRDLTRGIRRAFASAGLHVTSVSFERPYALAPVVTVQTRDPRHAVDAIRKADAVMPWRHSGGTLVRMLDGFGRTFYIEAGAWDGGSVGWTRRGLPTPMAITAATGTNGPTGPSGPGGPVSRAAPRSRAAWPQPRARDRALLASVLRGMRTDLRGVRLTQLAPGWRKGRKPMSLELVTATSVNPKAIVVSTKAEWDSLLIAHAYNERCFRQADHCISVDGMPSVGGPAGRSGVKEPYWSAHALARAIRHAFAAAGLRVTSISFEHPNALAPIITARSAHPRRAYRAERKAWLALLPVLRHTEGSFIRIFDRRGRLVFDQAGSGHTGFGWCAPWLHCPGL